MFHVKRFILLFCFLPIFSMAQQMGSTRLEVKEMPPLPTVDNNVKAFLNQYQELNNYGRLEIEWFYWTNYSRSNPKRFWDSVIIPLIKTHPGFNNSYSKSLKNDLSSAGPLPLLRPNVYLMRTSASLAKELASKNASPSHTSPSGITFSDRMKSIGVKKCAGENISFGSWNTVLMLVLLYIDEGVPSLGHRKSLLNPEFKEMGIGVGKYSDNRMMVVQDFACDQKSE